MTTHNQIQIGDFTLRHITVKAGDKPPYYDNPAIWIEHKSGEGMSVNVDKITDFIDKLWKEF